MNDQELGVNIRKMRTLRALSQENMANVLEISQKSYSRIEAGELSCTFKLLNHICDTLNIKLSALLEFKDSIVFNNNPVQSGGEYNAFNNTEIKNIEMLYERLLAEKDKVIEALRGKAGM